MSGFAQRDTVNRFWWEQIIRRNKRHRKRRRQIKTISRFIALKIVCGFLIFAFGGITFAQDDLNSGLAAYYPFNGNSNDESGNGNHGTVFGASLTTDRVWQC